MVDFRLVSFTVEATGHLRDTFDLVFTEELGDPPTRLAVVHGGEAFTPAVQRPATITFRTSTCARARGFTIDIADAEGETGQDVTSTVTLNFNKDGTSTGAELGGWSYGICIKDPTKLSVVGATSAGTDTATVNGGDPPDFESIQNYVSGITHGVVIDFLGIHQLPSPNDWTALVVTYRIEMTGEGEKTYVTPCSNTLGTPPVANVVVYSGASLPACSFEGTPEELEGPDGCCDPAICNRPGTFSFVRDPGSRFVAGDANGDGALDLADGIFILRYLFRGATPPPCAKAADANGDCSIDASDALYMVYFTLQPPGGPWSPPPGPPGCVLHKPAPCPSLDCETECEP